MTLSRGYSSLLTDLPSLLVLQRHFGAWRLQVTLLEPRSLSPWRQTTRPHWALRRRLSAYETRTPSPVHAGGRPAVGPQSPISNRMDRKCLKALKARGRRRLTRFRRKQLLDQVTVSELLH